MYVHVLYMQCSLCNKDTFIMTTFYNVQIGTDLYKSTYEMSIPLY